MTIATMLVLLLMQKKNISSEPLVIALILSQHKKMINWLIEKVSQNKERNESNQ